MALRSGRMPLLVDDIGKAHEGLLLEARAKGFVVVSITDRFDGPELQLDVQDLDGFLDLAKRLDARAIYVTSSTPVDADVVEETLEFFLAGEVIMGEDKLRPDFSKSMLRMFGLMRDVGFAFFRAGFLHAGVFHSLQVADKEAWPALEAIEDAADDDELPLNDLTEDEWADKNPRDLAQAIIDHLVDEGHTKAQLKRSANKLVAEAANELFPEPDELTTKGADRISQGLILAEARLKQGKL